ncbi:hypothetical protein Ahy_Scaffold1g106700 isoform E [Arachis hypogaea]|uniref:Uncharacterized protein n=1 Tax=Arachis hypogaea TaxID=3818 RepID=A0A444WRE5_ARAHY|nr:hypothetical protein Ahy_Scaffold1g106699 isoform D [Arachis hypogaea]RYQ79987.1 hypothetical protein Ahy_Scaffold1g106700 isoform E [Arachis hypogaea]
MLVIHIKNDGLKLNITVFGEMVDRIKALVAAGEQQLPVVIFQFARINNFLGTNILQNIMYGARLLINPDVPKVVMLRKSKYYREISQYLSVLSGKLAYINEDEVLYSTEKKTIKELHAAADVGFYVVLATVLNVEPVLSWWYKLNLLVFYGSVTTSFVVFDKEATALFGRTCTEMVKEFNVCGFCC